MTTPSRRRLLATGLGFLLAGPAALSGCRTRTDESDPSATPTSSPGEKLGEGPSGQGTVGLGIVGIIVTDLPRSLTFYRRLGLNIPTNLDPAADNYRLTLPNGNILFWETPSVIHTFDPDWLPSAGDRRVVLEFGFTDPGHLDQTYTDLVANRADEATATDAAGRLPPFWLTPDIRYAIVCDPDHNEISLRSPPIS